MRYFTLGSGTHLNPRAIAYQGLIRVFAYNPTTGDLEWCDSAPSCQWQPLDGSGGMNGRTTGDVGAECISAEVWDDELYVVHRQDDFAGSRRVIRVGLLKNGVWTFQTVDGHGFNGHGTTGQDVGGCPSMAAAPPWVFIGYSELASSAFRIGWSNRLSWDFQTNDGVGGANGRVQAPLSRYSTLITFNAVLHAFYSTTNGSLRVGEFTGLGADWTFSAAIPQAQPLDSAPFALVHDGKLSVFYRDGSLLRAATKPTYAPLVIDGDGLGGRGANDVGQYGGGAVFSGNTAHAFFYDATAGDLRHAQLTFGTWSVDTLDGDANEPDGRIDAEVGKSASAVRTSSGVAAVYEGPSESVRMVLIE